jgi:flagellar hook-basal body complex protein FliE
MIPAISLLGTVAADAIGSISSIAPAITGAGSAQGAAPADFGSMLAQITGDAVDKLKGSEATAISGIQGKASIQDVTKSVMDAQQSLQTVVAVRDKVVSAYQEVSRMAI